jgi:hypothetical protein
MGAGQRAAAVASTAWRMQSPPATRACTSVSSLRPGRAAPGPVAEVDELVGGLLDPQPLCQRGGQQQAGMRDGPRIIEGDIDLVQQHMGGSHRIGAAGSGRRSAPCGRVSSAGCHAGLARSTPARCFWSNAAGSATPVLPHNGQLLQAAGWPCASVRMHWLLKRTCQANKVSSWCWTRTAPSCQMPFVAHHWLPAGSPWFMWTS